MRYEVDSYTLEYVEDEDKYYISFRDSVEQDCRIEIDKDIFDTYTNSKKAYIKIKNETKRHLDDTEFTDAEQHNKFINKDKSLEDIVIDNIENEKLKKAKETLTDVQIRRIELHIVDEVTIRDLAKIEKVRTKQIEKSIKQGLKKIKNFFDN